MLLEDLGVKGGEEILVLVNGAGATTLMELLIVFRRVAQILAAKKINLVRSAVGESITTQEQAGFQIIDCAHGSGTDRSCGMHQRTLLFS